MNFIDENFFSDSPPSEKIKKLPSSLGRAEEEMTEELLILQQIEKANTYKLVLGSGIFESRDPISLQVEAELHQFIVSRLQTLLGLKEASCAVDFSKEEVAALKMVAKKILQHSPLSIETHSPQLKTVKVQTTEGEKENLSVKNTSLPSPIQVKKGKKKEGTSRIPSKSIAMISPEVELERPPMANSQQMALWAQQQADFASSGHLVMSASNTTQ